MIKEMLTKNVCTNAPIRCDDKCSQEIPRNKMEHHKLYECPNREIECPAPECKAKLPRHQFYSHFSRDTDSLQKHMAWLYEQEITDQMDRLNAREQEDGAVGGAEASSSAAAQVAQHVAAAGGAGAGGTAAAAPAPGQYLPTDIKQKLKLHEDLMSVLHGKILRCYQQIEALSNNIENGPRPTTNGINHYLKRRLRCVEDPRLQSG